MKKLHPKQQQLLNLLKENIHEPLTIRELQNRLDISSPSVVHHHIKQLEKKGYLRRNPVNPQDYQVLADEPEKKITYLNLYGMAQCGPNGKLLNGNPIDRIPISSQIIGFQSEDAFLVKARGNSMTPKISPGDLIISKKSNYAESGDIVVCTNKGEVLIKKISKENDSIILISLNQEYPPFLADKESFQIEGIVKGVISYLI